MITNSILYFTMLLGAYVYQEKIEVTVGEQIITTTDIDQVTKSITSLQTDLSPLQARSKARDLLIDQALIRQVLAEQGASIPSVEVGKRIEMIRGAKGTAFDHWVNSRFESFEKFRDHVQIEMERMQFLNIVRRNSMRTIEEKELMNLYQERHKEFEKNLEYDLAECFIPKGADEKKTSDLANDFQKNPHSFDKCVHTLSTSPSVEKGGRLGKFTRGTLPEEIESQIFSLKAGAVAVIRVDQGFQLLKILSIKDLGPLSFSQVKEKLREQLETTFFQNEATKILTNRRAETFIKIAG